ncbi:MAG: hypothetical protein M9887_02035 [Chitinophagales bacterium]|nr:hypothetical protein [Chitinophagales bacterium]
MVNSPSTSKIKGLPFKSILLLMLFMLSYSLYAKKIQSYYTTLVQEDGTLYHIYSLYEYPAHNKKAVLNFDLTYKTSQDSVTINYSIVDKAPILAKSISLETSKEKIELLTNRLFIEKKKSRWISRYTSIVGKNQIVNIINDSEPLNIIVEQENQKLKFEINGKKWSKQRKITQQIFSIISLNE